MRKFAFLNGFGELLGNKRKAIGIENVIFAVSAWDVVVRTIDFADDDVRCLVRLSQCLELRATTRRKLGWK